MKLQAFLLSAVFCLTALFCAGQSDTTDKTEPYTKAQSEEELLMEQEVPPPVEENVPHQIAFDGEQIKIPNWQLPDEAHTEITRNYYNGKITQAYKIVRDGKITGYLAEVKNGPNSWTLQFDINGNTMNKIPPNK